MNKVKCFKCGTVEGTIIKHHIRYIPEAIVDCCRRCHTKIHHKIRKEHTCTLSREETARLSALSCTKRRNKHKHRIHFSETLSKNVMLVEYIDYNLKDGSVIYSDMFRGHNGLKLPIVFI